MYRVTVPAVFFDDHMARDLTNGRIIGRRGRCYVVHLEQEDLEELYADALYYAEALESPAGWTEGVRGLARSARRTLAAIAIAEKL